MSRTSSFIKLSMRALSIITPLLASMPVNAQSPAGMNDADMQKLMQGAQAMQTCMQNVDKSAMERLQTESEQLQADIKSLCAAGKRDEALNKAMAFGIKAANDPAMKAMAECGKQMQGMMPQAPAMPYVDAEHEFAHRHVCDE